MYLHISLYMFVFFSKGSFTEHYRDHVKAVKSIKHFTYTALLCCDMDSVGNMWGVSIFNVERFKMRKR